MIKLFGVIDTRTGQYHSVAFVKERNKKYFVFAEEPAEEQEGEPDE